MDDGSVTPFTPSASWRLEPSIAAKTQGLVVSGYSSLPTGTALMLNIGTPAAPDLGGGAFLRKLAEIAPVTPAVPGARERSTALAFSWTGLQKLGMAETSLASFLRPFREGMMQEDRLRRLGDRREGQWLDTVQKGGPEWSANTPSPDRSQGARAYQVEVPGASLAIQTNAQVHAILLLYTQTVADADLWATDIKAALLPHGVTVVREVDLTLDVHDNSHFGREHFGFADGLSQPLPFDTSGAVLINDTPVTSPDPVQGVPLGEIMLGYLNGHQEVVPGPVVPGDDRTATARLEPHPEAQGFSDFGLNGSYLVVRELRQDVPAFWRSMDSSAAAIRAADPQGSAHVTADWVAERVIGRSKDGNLLCPGGYLPVDAQGDPNNGFLFLERDRRGLGCPIGSHVRRANPRDTLAPTADQGPTLLAAANNHRILRRGRKYGSKYDGITLKDPRLADPSQPDANQLDANQLDSNRADTADRGLLFMALNTDIARQFEFVQQTWLLNSNFGTLFQEVDPLIGPEGRMTIPEDPLRRTIQVKTFIQMVGGDYFFLPSLPALAYLAML